MEQEAWWAIGLEERGLVAVEEKALEEARARPRIVTVRASVFSGSGRKGSFDGRTIIQFSVAPPMIAPDVRANIGVKSDGVCSLM